MQWYLQALSKYAVFSGRARRKEYWFFVLFQVMAVLVISFVERWLAIANPEILFGWFTALFVLATWLPALALTTRRLHDSAHSGWWLLLYLVPFLGFLILQIFMLLNGTADSNRYGADPRLAGR